jgi:hypothetical protein
MHTIYISYKKIGIEVAKRLGDASLVTKNSPEKKKLLSK